jgi:hypothetical protein
LEFLKIFKHLRFIAKQIDPREFTIIINETNIVFFLPKESMAGPHTSEKISSKGALDLLVETEYSN